MPHVEAIHITTTKGKPMQAVEHCSLLAGRGIDGDRYVRGAGTFSHWPKDHELTLVEAEVIESLNAAKFSLVPGQSRRNLTTRGIRLNELIGVEFFIGTVRVKGTRLCEPCNHLERIAKMPGLIQAMKGRGGLRAVILNDGEIKRGDEIAIPRRNQLAEDGFANVENALPSKDVAALLQHVESLQGHAHRNLLDLPWARELVNSVSVRQLVEPILGAAVRPVRGILFDKVAGANWKVPWHQDLSIAVKHRAEVEGYGPWSLKEGVVHVQPPVKVLEQMLTVRLHLDDCGLDNGPLKVIPGSHRNGVLSAEQITAMRKQTAEIVCTCLSGGAVLMRPLLLHASSSAEQVGHRRVVHIEFASAPLAEGVEWAF